MGSRLRVRMVAGRDHKPEKGGKTVDVTTAQNLANGIKGKAPERENLPVTNRYL